jgi:hypothetical protein
MCRARRWCVRAVAAVALLALVYASLKTLAAPVFLMEEDQRLPDQRGDDCEAGTTGNVRGAGQMRGAPGPGAHRKGRGGGSWWHSTLGLPASDPPDGPFNDLCAALFKVEHGVQGGGGNRTHFKVAACRVDDFHEGMAAAGGVHRYAVDDSSKTRKGGQGAVRFACPRRAARPRKEQAGPRDAALPAEAATAADAVPQPQPPSAAAPTARRGAAAPRPEALWGAPHTHCEASYTVTVRGEWALVRLGLKGHNHSVNTLPRFVSDGMRSSIEQGWRRDASAAPAAECERLVERLVDETAAQRGVDPKALREGWADAARRQLDGEDVPTSELPPRDYFLTAEYVREVYQKLQDDMDGIGGRGEHEVVESWIAANPEHVWHSVPGTADDEKDVRPRACITYPHNVPILSHTVPTAQQRLRLGLLQRFRQGIPARTRQREVRHDGRDRGCVSDAGGAPLTDD